MCKQALRLLFASVQRVIFCFELYKPCLCNRALRISEGLIIDWRIHLGCIYRIANGWLGHRHPDQICLSSCLQ